jgi:hypothetical protein
MINPTTGEKTPVGYVSDAEITCDAETTEMVKTFYNTREFNPLVYASIQIDDIEFSDLITKLFRKLTSNYRRLHGGRAIRWRKMR